MTIPQFTSRSLEKTRNIFTNEEQDKKACCSHLLNTELEELSEAVRQEKKIQIRKYEAKYLYL